jgi:hypothetical protein
MSTLGGTMASRKQSRLAEIMRTFSGSRGGPGFGFKSQVGPRKRVTALVASFDAADVDTIGAAIEAGADAVELRFGQDFDLSGLASLVKRVTVPLGIALPPDADSAAAAIADKAQVDWVRLPIDAHISTMEWDRPVRILTVPFELDLEVAHGLTGLAVDAVLIDQSSDRGGEFTYLDALRLRALGGLIKKPLLLHSGPGLPPGAAAAGEQLGADAVMVYLSGRKSIETLSAYLRALEHRAQSPQ